MPTRSTSECEYIYWPPGPSETEEWQRILEQRPDLAPAVEKEAQPEFLRMVDGSASWLESANAYRSERLQALGNGVCVLTGAIALKVLWQRMEENE